MHRDPRDLGLICPLKKRKIRFQILSDLGIQSWILIKETHPKCSEDDHESKLVQMESNGDQ